MLLDVVKYKNNFISVSNFNTVLPPDFTGIYSGKENIVWETVNEEKRNDWIKFIYTDKINIVSVSITVDVPNTVFDYMFLEKSYDGFDKYEVSDDVFNYNNITNVLEVTAGFTEKVYFVGDSILLSTAHDKPISYKIVSLLKNGNNKVIGLKLNVIPELDSLTDITITIVDDMFWTNVFPDNRYFTIDDFNNGLINLEVNSTEKTPYFRVRFFGSTKIKLTKISVMSDENIKQNDLIKTYFFSRQRNKMPEIFEGTDLINVYNTYIENMYDKDSLVTDEVYAVRNITPKENIIKNTTKFFDIIVESDDSWKLNKSANWITQIVPEFGFGNKVVKVFVADAIGTQRTGTIFCNDKDGNLISTTIIQESL